LTTKKIEKSWGYYEILHEEPNFLIKKLTIHPTHAISFQYHKHREEMWYVIDGDGAFTLDGNQFLGTPGFAFVVKPGEKHQVRNIRYDKDLVAIEVWRGDILSEDDIVRL
jgi:mannose-6-phosphate isomerase-like protein (cupin superfamily)